MLAHFFIPRLLNDMKLALQKNDSGRSNIVQTSGPVKKNGVNSFDRKAGDEIDRK